MATTATQLIHSFMHSDHVEGNFNGLNKREFFAALAMQGLCASGANDFNVNHVDVIADIAVKQADALINALNN